MLIWFGIYLFVFSVVVLSSAGFLRRRAWVYLVFRLADLVLSLVLFGVFGVFVA